jgi:serine/threonine-protein phosphatase PGAM5
VDQGRIAALSSRPRVRLTVTEFDTVVVAAAGLLQPVEPIPAKVSSLHGIVVRENMANRFLYLARHGEAIDDGELSDAGRQQARLLGQRLAKVPLSAIYHGPLVRAVQTAEILSESFPGVPVVSAEAVGDYFPPVPDLRELPDVYARFLSDVSTDEFTLGARLAAEAIARHTAPVAVDTHELIITHNFLAGWLVRHALDAPDQRWLGLNHGNCALSVIRYRPDRPPTLVTFNDLSHLPPAIRWTGVPPELHI